MNYVESFRMFGEDAFQIPCKTGAFIPTTATTGAVGCLFMRSDNGDMYKCINASGGVYTWEQLDHNHVVFTYVWDSTTDSGRYECSVTHGKLCDMIHNNKLHSIFFGTYDSTTKTSSFSQVLHASYTVDANGAKPITMITRMSKITFTEDGTVTMEAHPTTVTNINGKTPNSSGKVTLDVGVKTINNQTPDANGNITIDVGDGTNTLIVTVDENNTPSHSAAEIYAHNGPVMLDINGQRISLSSTTQGSAYFSFTNDEHISTVYEVYGEQLASTEREYVSLDYFDSQIGDISSALDELHAYAEALKGGGAV